MTVKELIDVLQRCPKPDMQVVTSGFDHSYEELGYARLALAEVYPDGVMTEYYDGNGDLNNDVVQVMVLG